MSGPEGTAGEGSRHVVVAHVDDDPFVANAIRGLLDVAGCEQIEWRATTVAEALEGATGDAPDLVVFDLYFGAAEADGIELACACAAAPGPPVAILTSSGSAEDADRAWKAGIRAYLSKRRLLASPAGIATTVDLVRAGDVVFHVDPREASHAGGDSLSAREVEILERKVGGATHRAMAAELHVSARTIDAHLANIRKKLGAASIDDAIRLAIDAGLVARPGR